MVYSADIIDNLFLLHLLYF